jgi:hypothetical protein
MEPLVWHTLVIRLWRDGDGLKVRFLASQTGQRLSSLTLATSVESAARQFEQWLRSTDPDAGRIDDGQAASSRRTAPLERRRRRGDDGGATAANTSRSYRPQEGDDATGDDVRREPS